MDLFDTMSSWIPALHCSSHTEKRSLPTSCDGYISWKRNIHTQDTDNALISKWPNVTNVVWCVTCFSLWPQSLNWSYLPLLCRHSATKGIVIAMICTFFDAFNVPVFWPILVMYFIMLFCITMKRQIKVKYTLTHINTRLKTTQKLK